MVGWRGEEESGGAGGLGLTWGVDQIANLIPAAVDLQAFAFGGEGLQAERLRGGRLSGWLVGNGFGSHAIPILP